MEPGFYDRFYAATKTSVVHSRFCRSVFGEDLCQHGFADVGQLELALSAVSVRKGQKVVDIGCGDGKTARHIQNLTGADVLGIDNCEAAVASAIDRFSRRRGLGFEIGDINHLHLASHAFDAALLTDSIYFSDDYRSTIECLTAGLKTDGALAIFYSIGPALMRTEDIPPSTLRPEGTPLADAMRASGLLFQCSDLTDGDYLLAKRRKEYLEKYRNDFERGGLLFVWENRYGDSVDIARAIEKGQHRRYLYYARMSRSGHG